MLTIESREVERLRKLIDYKRKELERPKVPDFAKRILQGEILFLTKDILPIVQADTSILHYECGKCFYKALDLSVRFDVDSFIVYIPLKDEFSKVPKIGMFNGKDSVFQSGSIFLSIYEVENNEGNIVKPEIIPLNSLVL